MSAEFDAKNLNNFEEDERLWELLSAYVDGETTPAESAIVEAHLRSDAAYAQDFAFLKATARQVLQVGEVAPPAELREAIFAATIYKPTLSRRLAKALGQLQSAISPRYALPAGALAAGIFAAVLFVPKSTDNHTVNLEPKTVAVTPDIKTVPNSNPADTPKSSNLIGTQRAPKIARSTEKPLTAPLKQPEINFEQMLSSLPVREMAKADIKPVIMPKVNAPKVAAAAAETLKKASNNAQRIATVDMKIKTPLPKKNEMFDDFTPVPNMDRENQRTVVINNPKTETLPNDEVTPSAADTTPTANAAAPTVAETKPRLFTVRSTMTRPLPDSRRIATAAQFRTEQSEFQQGMSRSTMLAMQRDELSGSTVTRF